jgi:hypothetical protein
MITFRNDRWLGNKWASIDISPVDVAYFLRVLSYLSMRYGFKMPPIIDLIDGYAADFTILDSKASIHIDTWTFSIAFEAEPIRDRLIAELQALPTGFFEVKL